MPLYKLNTFYIFIFGRKGRIQKSFKTKNFFPIICNALYSNAGFVLSKNSSFYRCSDSRVINSMYRFSTSNPSNIQTLTKHILATAVAAPSVVLTWNKEYPFGGGSKCTVDPFVGQTSRRTLKIEMIPHLPFHLSRNALFNWGMLEPKLSEVRIKILVHYWKKKT